MRKLCFLVLVSCLALFGCKPPGYNDSSRTQLLTVTPSPANGGTVAPSGQTRQNYCSWVTLTASPAPGYEFSHWGGDISGSDNPNGVSMDEDKAIEAIFKPIYSLTVTGTPSDGGTVNPPGRSQHVSGSRVTLTASPAIGYEFAQWEGDAVGSANPTTITVDGDKTVTAVFTPATTPLIRLSSSAVLFHVDKAAWGSQDSRDTIVDIMNGGIGTLDGLSISFPDGCPGWLSVTLSGSTAPTVLTVGVLVSKLPPIDSFSLSASVGTRVAIASATAKNSPQLVRVGVSTGFPLPNGPILPSGPIQSGLVGGKVICAELHRQGLMDEAIWKADEAFGEYLRNNHREVLLGYQVWAKPVVNWMQKSRTITKIVASVATPWSYEMAYRMGARDEGSFVGKILMDVGVPVCRTIGRVAMWTGNSRGDTMLSLGLTGSPTAR